MDWDRVIGEARKSVLHYAMSYLETWYLIIISKHRYYVPFRTYRVHLKNLRIYDVNIL
jgi:hypothetical protein